MARRFGRAFSVASLIGFYIVFVWLLNKTVISRNIHEELHDDRMFGERVADRVALFGGSWTFIIIFGAVLIFFEVILNSYILSRSDADFDPYPYILLNLFL